jgi:excinuclease ABC subunit C
MRGGEVFHFPDGREISLPVNAPVLFYLQRLRDEAHRYAIGAHRTKRAKAITASPWTKCPALALRAKRRCFCTSARPRSAQMQP